MKRNFYLQHPLMAMHDPRMQYLLKMEKLKGTGAYWFVIEKLAMLPAHVCSIWSFCVLTARCIRLSFCLCQDDHSRGIQAARGREWAPVGTHGNSGDSSLPFSCSSGFAEASCLDDARSSRPELAFDFLRSRTFLRPVPGTARRKASRTVSASVSSKQKMADLIISHCTPTCTCGTVGSE